MDALVVCTKDRPGDISKFLMFLSSKVIEVPGCVIIVDSSFDDQTEKLVKELSKTSIVNLLYIRSLPGLPHQRNVGVKEALKSTGIKYISFLDDDVIPSISYFANARKILEMFPDIAVLGGFDPTVATFRISWIRVFLGFAARGTNNLSKAGFGIPPRPLTLVEDYLWVPGGMQTIRAEFLRACKFNGRIRMYGEDIDMHLRLSQFGRICASSELEVTHMASQAGKDDWRKVMARESAFRWRLASEYPDLVLKRWVILSTVIYGLATLVSRGTLATKCSKVLGCFDFLKSVVLGTCQEDFVSHDSWVKFSKPENSFK